MSDESYGKPHPSAGSVYETAGLCPVGCARSAKDRPEHHRLFQLAGWIVSRFAAVERARDYLAVAVAHWLGGYLRFFFPRPPRRRTVLRRALGGS